MGRPLRRARKNGTSAEMTGTCSAYSENEQEMQSAYGLTVRLFAAHARTRWMCPCRSAENTHSAPVLRVRHAHGRRLDEDTFSDERAGCVRGCAVVAAESESELWAAEIRKSMIAHIWRNSTAGSEVTLCRRRVLACVPRMPSSASHARIQQYMVGQCTSA